MTEHRDRRRSNTPPRNFALVGETLAWRDADAAAGHAMPLADIRQVRLSVEMAGRDSQVVCRVTDRAGREIAFGSMRWVAPGRWEAAADTFQALLRELHAGLLPYRADIRFVEGPRTGFMLAMFGTGLAVTAASLFFFALLFLVHDNALGLFLIPGVVAGVWLTRLFWPRPAKPYDPETYARAS